MLLFTISFGGLLMMGHQARGDAVLYQFGYSSASKAEISSVQAAIADWSADNNIEVEALARDQIVKETSRHHGDLTEVYSGVQDQFPSYYSVLRVFTRIYLYMVAARRHSDEKRRVAAHAFLGAMSQLQVGFGYPTSRGGHSITRSIPHIPRAAYHLQTLHRNSV